VAIYDLSDCINNYNTQHFIREKHFSDATSSVYNRKTEFKKNGTEPTFFKTEQFSVFLGVFLVKNWQPVYKIKIILTIVFCLV